ncbi:MAG: allantoinase AllB [Ferruginibacter sp.]
MFALKSNRVIVDGTVREACVLIDEGIIAGVLPFSSIPRDIRIEDWGNDVIMAGIVDTHVHINEPGRQEWEGFDTATKAAMAGGVCSMIEMPLNAEPVTTDVKSLEKKFSAALHKLHTNVGFWGGIIPGNAQEIEKMAAAGVFGFKAFLTHSGIDEFPNVTAADLDLAMPIIKDCQLPLLVHCELSNDKLHPSTRIYREYAATRPASWEVSAIALMINMCRKHKCPVHIVHLSAAEALPLIQAAKDEGLPLTVETAQHYLYFNGETIPDGQTQFKCAPPIRESVNNEKLWQALEKGLIDFVATDHSPAPPGMKHLETGDFMQAWGGIASLQFALPALWTAAKKRGLKEACMAEWLCRRPAQLAGLSAKKGDIAKGKDADILIWQPEASFEVSEENILHRHKITPYLGENLFGKTSATYLAGEKIYENGNILQLNKGKILKDNGANK